MSTMDYSGDILRTLQQLHCGLVPHVGGRPFTEYNRWDTHSKQSRAGVVQSGNVPRDDMGRPLFAGCVVSLERESGGLTNAESIIQAGVTGNNEEFGAVLRVTAGSSKGSMGGVRRPLLGPHAPVFLRIGAYENFNIEVTFVGAGLTADPRWDIACTWLREFPADIPSLHSPWRQLSASNVPSHTHAVPAGAVELINGVTPITVRWRDTISLGTGGTITQNESLAAWGTTPVAAKGTSIDEIALTDAYIKWRLANF